MASLFSGYCQDDRGQAFTHSPHHSLAALNTTTGKRRQARFISLVSPSSTKSVLSFVSTSKKQHCEQALCSGFSVFPFTVAAVRQHQSPWRR